MLQQGFSASFHKTSISREQAAGIPYASLGFRIDGGNQGLLVLATDKGGEQLWTAATHIVLQTRDGRILRTIGLPSNRSGMVGTKGADLPPISDALRGPYQSGRLVDLPGGAGYGVPLTCTAVKRGSVRINILQTALTTTRIDETCRSTGLQWSFTDSYWVDAGTGFVWRSLQHLTPSGPVLEIEILRPPG